MNTSFPIRKVLLIPTALAIFQFVATIPPLEVRAASRMVYPDYQSDSSNRSNKRWVYLAWHDFWSGAIQWFGICCIQPEKHT